jgi:hypothetical protein
MENLARKKLREFLGQPFCNCLEPSTIVDAIRLAEELDLPAEPQQREDFLVFFSEWVLSQVDPDKPTESEEWQAGYMTAMEQLRSAWGDYTQDPDAEED